MAKQKYDWPALKLEFFQSDIDEAKVFIEGKIGPLNWNLKKQIAWWQKEKQAYKDKILQKALERQAAKEAKSLELSVWTLMKAKKMALTKIIKMMAEEDLDMSDMDKGLKNIKTELWEPTNIWSNYNFNKNKDDWVLSDEDRDFIESLFMEKTNEQKWDTKRKTTRK